MEVIAVFAEHKTKSQVKMCPFKCCVAKSAT